MVIKVLTILILIAVIVTINPLLLYSESNTMQENKLTEDKDEMPVKSKDTGKIVKIVFIIMNFLVTESISIGLFSSISTFTVFLLGIIGGEMQADMRIPLVLIISTFVCSGITLTVLLIKRLIISIMAISNTKAQ